MKQKSITILTVSLIVLGMLGVMLIVYVNQAHEEFKESVQVNESGVTEQVLVVRDLMLNPAEKKQYEVELTCLASGQFDITLDYDEIENGGMKPFVNVRIFCEEQELYSGTLVDLLDNGRTVVFREALHATEPLVLCMVYEMPYETGNEAQEKLIRRNLYG